MKAIVIREFGPPDVLRYEDLPDPPPRRGEQAQRGVELPLIPGVDCAGIVDAVGEGVTKFKIGDRVCAAGRMALDPCDETGSDATGRTGMMGIKRPGGFAEKVCVPAAAAFPLPDALGFHDAAVVMRHCPTAWNLLVNIAQLKAGEWAMIMGASGNLGSVGVQIAKHVLGARVIAVAGSRARADAALDLGADHAIDYSTQDLTAEAMRVTDGRGVSVLYDNIANPDVLPQAFHALGENGRLVTAGAHGGPNVTIDFFHLYDRKITIRGMPGSRDSDRPKCFQAAAEGKIKVRIAHVLPLSQAAEAHRMMEADAGMGKIVLDPTRG